MSVLWCHGAKMVDFGVRCPRDLREDKGVEGLAREGVRHFRAWSKQYDTWSIDISEILEQ